MVTGLCRAGLHAMTAENAGVQPSTGRQYCRGCKREYRRARKRTAREAPGDLCSRGLHDLSDETNVYVRPGTGRRECRPCKADADLSRRDAQVAEEAAADAACAEADAARRAASRAVAAGPYGSPRHARVRLALIVRAERGA